MLSLQRIKYLPTLKSHDMQAMDFNVNRQNKSKKKYQTRKIFTAVCLRY